MSERSPTPPVSPGIAAPRLAEPPKPRDHRSTIDRPRGPITLRSLIIGFVLIPINSLWIVYTEIVRYAGHPTTTSLYFNVIFCLFILVGLNALLRRTAPTLALRQSE